jgi:tetratricopeptide (TPR) repeat protein
MLVTFAKPDPFNPIVELHRAGRMAEAEAQYRQFLAANPQHADVHHMLGLLLHQTGRSQEGLVLIQRAIAILPTNPLAYSNLAEILRQLGRPEEAERICRQALALQPNLGAAHVNLAMAIFQQRRFKEALPHALRAIELGPREHNGYSVAGICLAEMQQVPDAIRYFEEAIKLNSTDTAVLATLANLYARQELNDKAVATMRRAVDLAPNDAQTLLNMGSLMAQLEKFDASAEWLEKSLALKPDFLPALASLASVRAGQKRFEESIALSRRITAIAPDELDVLATMAESLMNLGQFDEAIAEMQRCLAIKPRAGMHQSLSNAYTRTGRPELGLIEINQAIALDPNNAVLHFNKSIILLLLGRMQEAWPEYEWRWQHPRMVGRNRAFGVPQWDGRPLNGARILLHAEQGLGDTIFFGRYATLIARERGGKPILWVPNAIVEVARTIEGVVDVVGEAGPVPPFDTHLPIMSLPRVFNTSLETVPNKVPYIRTDPVRSARWKKELAERTGKFKVGLVWYGGDFQPENFLRSNSLAAYAPLADVPNVAFFSLQKGHAEIQSKNPPPGMDFTDLAPFIKDFSDTSAILENLDLLISIDTSVIHFAAALAKPVWMLLAYAPGHMWMFHREDTPWYPTVRIFRQPAFKDWATPVGRVKLELDKLANGPK